MLRFGAAEERRQRSPWGPALPRGSRRAVTAPRDEGRTEACAHVRGAGSLTAERVPECQGDGARQVAEWWSGTPEDPHEQSTWAALAFVAANDHCLLLPRPPPPQGPEMQQGLRGGRLQGNPDAAWGDGAWSS